MQRQGGNVAVQAVTEDLLELSRDRTLEVVAVATGRTSELHRIVQGPGNTRPSHHLLQRLPRHTELTRHRAIGKQEGSEARPIRVEGTAAEASMQDGHGGDPIHALDALDEARHKRHKTEQAACTHAAAAHAGGEM
jgi:hypothetical protein